MQMSLSTRTDVVNSCITEIIGKFKTRGIAWDARRGAQYFIHSRQQYWPAVDVVAVPLMPSKLLQSLMLVRIAVSSSVRSPSQAPTVIAARLPVRQARRICWWVHRDAPLWLL